MIILITSSLIISHLPQHHSFCLFYHCIINVDKYYAKNGRDKARSCKQNIVKKKIRNNSKCSKTPVPANISINSNQGFLKAILLDTQKIHPEPGKVSLQKTG